MSRIHARLNGATTFAVRYVNHVRTTMLSRPGAAKVSGGTTPGLVVRHSAVRIPRAAGGQRSGLRLPSLVRPSRRTVWVTLLLCIAFYAAARIGLALHFPDSLVYFVWPPSVLVFVALVLSPRRNWWVYFLALFPIHMLVEWRTVAAPPAIIALFYVPVWTQALAGAVCVRRFAGRPLRLDTVRQLIIFLFGGVVVASMTEAITLAIILTLTTSGSGFWLTIGQTTLADALTTVVLAPALVSGWVFARRLGIISDEAASVRDWLTGVSVAVKAWHQTLSVSRVVEASLLGLGLFGVAFLAFGDYFDLPGTLPALLYTLLPLLLWSAMRFDLGGTSLALCGLTLMSILFAIHGSGPFSRFSTTVNLFSLQLFFIAISIPALVLAVLMQERSEAEAALHESEARFRTMADQAPVLIWMSGPDALCTYFNAVWLDFTGRTLEQERGAGWMAGIHPHDRAHCAEMYLSAFEARQPFALEYRLRRHDGTYRWLVCTGVPRYAPNGRFEGYIGSDMDITDRKQAAEALERSEARYRDLVESQTDMICRYLPDSTLTFVNEAYCRHYGKSHEQLVGTKFFDLLDADGREYHARYITALLQHSQVSMDEHQINLPSGSVAWQQWIDHTIRDANGNVVEIQSIGRDITDRKRAEEALRASEQRYRAVVNNFPRGVVLLFEQRLCHIFADGQGLSDLGLTKAAIEGKTIWEAFPADLSAALASKYQAALTGTVAEFDLTFAGRTYQTQVLPIDYGETAPAGMAILQDVTEQRRVEVLAELDRAKTAFFSNVSHEFRTPLTLLVGPTADALADRKEPLPPRQRQRLDLIQRGALRLLKLVNSLLDFSRIQAGHIQPSFAPTDVSALTADLASTFRTAAERAGLRLVVDCAALDDLPRPVYVDHDMWEQIVLNLISNALKFTLQGEIAVSVRTTSEQDDLVQLEVRDTGVGIPAKDLPHLFERFYRVDNARARTAEGTGIGLAVVQELVRLHGGTVRVTSVPAVGSTFTVTIPTGNAHLPADRVARREYPSDARIQPARRSDAVLVADKTLETLPETPEVWPAAAAPAAAAAAAVPAWDERASGSQTPFAEAFSQSSNEAHAGVQAADLGRATILVADDHADMRAYLARLLSERWEVRTVADGVSALAAARSQQPDLILADVIMPGTDGFALIAALRDDPQTRALPVILLSARAGEEATVEGLQAGADDYLIKPFSARELVARVQTHLELARVRKESAARAAQLDAIFEAIGDGVLVHDIERQTMRANPAQRDLLRRHLEMLDHHVDPKSVFAMPAEREQHIVVRDEDGHILPLEGWPTERALHGETLTGVNAVDEFTQGVNGEILQLNVSAAPIRNASGQITGAVAVFRDVTERRQLERQVAEQASQLEAIFAAQADGVAVFDEHGHFLRSNQALSRILGMNADRDYTARSLTERMERVLLLDEEGQRIPESHWPHWRVLRGEILAGANAMDARIRTLDDRDAWISITGAPVQNADGRLTGVVLVTRDVTARRQLERQIAEQASQLQAIFDTMTDGVFVLDQEGCVTRINAAGRRLVGLADGVAVLSTAEERARALDMRDAEGQPLPPDLLPTARLLRGEVLAGATAQTFTMTVRSGVKEVRTVSLTGAPLRGAGDGQIYGAVAVFRDTTELRRTQAALAEQERLFRTLVENSPDIITRFDRNLHHLYVSPASEAVIGIPARLRLGKTYGELGLPEEAYAPWEDALRTVFETGQPQTFESGYHAEGKPAHVSRVTYIPEFTADGSVESVLGITTNITTLKETEEALRRQERLFRTLVENSPDIIARFDRELRYLYINPAIANVAPIPPARYLGKTNQELGFPESFYAPAHRAMEQVFETGESLTLLEDDSAFYDAQAARYYRAQILPEFAEDGTVESVLTVTTEVTDLKRAEEALRDATAKAEAAQRAEELRRHEAERREQIAESLRDVLTILNSDRQVSKVLDYITRQAGRLLSSDAVAIYMTDFDAAQGDGPAAWTAQAAQAAEGAQGSLTVRAAFGLPSALTSSRGKRRLSVGDAAVRQAMVARRPVAVLAPPDAVSRVSRADQPNAKGIEPITPVERARETSDEVAEYIVIREEQLPEPYRALLAIPIITQDQAYGSMLLLYTTPHRVSADEAALAMAYGDQIALAMANAHLQDHIERAAAEAERNRLARDLHDTVTQEIFTASVLAESIPAVWERHRDEAEASLRQVHQLTRSALAALRALLLELRPAVLEQKSLDDLLRQLAEVMSMRSGVPIAVTIAEDCPPLPIDVKVAFYRIAQEALMNAAKYAGAQTIVVRLRFLRAEEAIQLDVQDDGLGFEAGAVPAGHFGLGMMRERARAAGATLRITSHHGQGTRVALRWGEKKEAASIDREHSTARRAGRKSGHQMG